MLIIDIQNERDVLVGLLVSSKLKSRLLFGSLGIPLIAIFALAPHWVIYLVFSAIMILTYNEALNLVHDKVTDFPYLLGVVSILGFITPSQYTLLHYFLNPSVGIICFLFIIAYDILKNVGFNKTSQHYFIVSYIALGFWAVINLFHANRFFALFIVLLIWTFDSFQYFVGRAIGRTKIFKVSPNKSLEGLIGGAVITVIFYVIWYFMFRYILIKVPILGIHSISFKDFFVTNNLVDFFVAFFKIVPGLIFFGIFGDLLVSQMKRSFEVKDSSNILGDHGGFLDRLDSVISVCIAIYVLMFTI